MTQPRAARLHVLQVLAQRAGTDAGAEAVADAARRTYDDLARVSVPLIGKVGLDALSGRAVHLALRKCPGLVQPAESSRRGQAEGAFAQTIEGLGQQDAAFAAECAAALLGSLTGLLVTFIGEPLTLGLLRNAWPDALTDTVTTEK
jgi:hypothetical protein